MVPLPVCRSRTKLGIFATVDRTRIQHSSEHAEVASGVIHRQTVLYRDAHFLTQSQGVLCMLWDFKLALASISPWQCLVASWPRITAAPSRHGSIDLFWNDSFGFARCARIHSQPIVPWSFGPRRCLRCSCFLLAHIVECCGYIL